MKLKKAIEIDALWKKSSICMCFEIRSEKSTRQNHIGGHFQGSVTQQNFKFKCNDSSLKQRLNGAKT